MKIYVASSWRNDFQQGVVTSLRSLGHEVYDFKDSDGFHWTEADTEWRRWPENVKSYLAGLNHPCAVRGFRRDMEALKACDVCIMVMPCGVSAAMEMGWAVGAGRPVAVYTPGIREPDLMVKMASLITDEWDTVLAWISGLGWLSNG